MLPPYAARLSPPPAPPVTLRRRAFAIDAAFADYALMPPPPAAASRFRRHAAAAAGVRLLSPPPSPRRSAAPPPLATIIAEEPPPPLRYFSAARHAASFRHAFASRRGHRQPFQQSITSQVPFMSHRFSLFFRASDTGRARRNYRLLRPRCRRPPFQPFARMKHHTVAWFADFTATNASYLFPRC